jgi:hypothetical protein
MKPRSAGHLHYKGFPKKRNYYKGFPKKCNYPDGFSFITFSCSGFVSRRGSMKKMADCETTTGHVGLSCPDPDERRAPGPQSSDGNGFFP